MKVTLQSQDIREALYRGYGPAVHDSGHSARQMQQLGLLAQHEPPTLGHVVGLGDNIAGIDEGTWRLEVPAAIVAYADVVTVHDYLNRLAQEIDPPQVPFAHSGPSPFSIPEAVSFLDAVWHSHVGRSLFVNVDPARAASLLYEAHTPDEFDSRCSALADVLYRIEVPPDDGLQRKRISPVMLLRQWLERRGLPEGPARRVDETMLTLSKIINIRVGGQHAADRRKQVEAFQELGLVYPPTDWEAAWGALRQSAVYALAAIREDAAPNLPRIA